MFDAGGNFLRKIGTEGDREGQLKFPRGVTTDEDGEWLDSVRLLMVFHYYYCHRRYHPDRRRIALPSMLLSTLSVSVNVYSDQDKLCRSRFASDWLRMKFRPTKTRLVPLGYNSCILVGCQWFQF